jgi:ABC-type branched-subunit amino acid transport system substrate-binding protein
MEKMKKCILVLMCLTVVLCTAGMAWTAETADTIRFGIGCPLTGGNASYGELMVLGATLAIDELNAKGGILGKKVELVPIDDKNDPKEAALVAQRFCDDPSITAVISHGGSSPTLAAAPIYEAAKMSHMAPSSSNGRLTELGYEYFVRHTIRDDRQGPQVIAFLKNNIGCENIAVIHANNDYGRGCLDFAVKAAEEVGAKVVAVETYNPGLEKDFSALLTKIQRSGADGVAMFADYTDGGLIMNQAYNLGLDIPFCGQSGLTYKRLIELAGPGALGKLYATVTFNPYNVASPQIAHFMDLFNQKRQGEIPSEPCAFSYDVVNVFAQALEAGATKENLSLWIKNKVPNQPKFVGKNCLLGDDLVWDEFGDVQPRGVDVLRVEGDNFVNTDFRVDTKGLKSFFINQE